MQNLREKESMLLGKMLTISNTGESMCYGVSPTRFVPNGHLSLVGPAANSDFNDQWKVLIYDKDCRDIISPLLNIGALRQKGVTLHMEVQKRKNYFPYTYMQVPKLFVQHSSD